MPTPARQVRSLLADDLRSGGGPPPPPPPRQDQGILLPTRIIGLLASNKNDPNYDEDDDLEDPQPPSLALTNTNTAGTGGGVPEEDRFHRVAISSDPPETEAPPPSPNSALVAARSTSLASGGVYYADEEEPSLDQSWLSVPPPPPLPPPEEPLKVIPKPEEVVKPVESSDATTDASDPSPKNTDKMMAGTPHWDQTAMERHIKPGRKRCLLLAVAAVLVIVAAAVSVPVVLWQLDSNNTSEMAELSSTSSNLEDTNSTTTANATPTPSPRASKTDPPSPRDKNPAGQTEDDATTTSRPSTSTVVRNTPAPKEQTNVRTGAPVAAPTISPAPVSLAPVTTPPIATDSVLVQRLLKILPLEYQSSLNSNAIAWMLQQSTTWNDFNTTDTALQQRYAMVALDVALASSHRDQSSLECEWSGVTCNDTMVTAIVWPSEQLSGSLPSELGLLPQLTVLDLADNAIGGTLPEALYTLSSSLQQLYLFQNQLTGTLSESVANLDVLEKMLLGENQLSGPLPQGLGAGEGNDARPLTWLSLYKNNFSGTIPSEWNLRNLFYLDLGNNDLTGTVPLNWSSSRDLESVRILYLDHNRLSGELPSDFIAETGNGRIDILLVNDNALTGEFPGQSEIVNRMDIVEFQHNDFTSMDTALCSFIVFSMGEMISLKADCEVCRCKYFCDDCY